MLTVWTAKHVMNRLPFVAAAKFEPLGSLVRLMRLDGHSPPRSPAVLLREPRLPPAGFFFGKCCTCEAHDHPLWTHVDDARFLLKQHFCDSPLCKLLSYWGRWLRPLR